MAYGVKLHVWGEYACFTRPEMNVAAGRPVVCHTALSATTSACLAAPCRRRYWAGVAPRGLRSERRHVGQTHREATSSATSSLTSCHLSTPPGALFYLTSPHTSDPFLQNNADNSAPEMDLGAGAATP